MQTETTRTEGGAGERRVHLRIHPERPLLAIYKRHLGQVHNFSVTGAFIESAHPALPGQRLQLAFCLDLLDTFEVEALVRRVEPLRGVGVEFLNLSGTGVRFLCNCWGGESPRTEEQA